MKRIVIVGAGEAGARAALGQREGGHAGAITLIGDEPHAPYERPPLSKAFVLEEDEPSPTIADARDLGARGIEVRHGARVASLDPARKTLTLTDGESIGYDILVLATGARPRRLSIPGGEHAQTLRSVEDARRIRAALRGGARTIIIGGGLIGLELAASGRKLGCEVSVIEAAARILTRGVPEVFARRLAERHRAEGVHLFEGCGLIAIERRGAAFDVRLANGQTLEADFVTAGVGAEPNVELARAAGLAIDNGITVDENLRTSDPDIFAVGDCANFPLLAFGGRRIRLEAWRNAFDQGAHVAKAILGTAGAYRAVPWFWSDQYDWTLQITGVPDLGRSVVTRPMGGGAEIAFHMAEDGVLTGASALGPLSAIGKDMRIAEMLVSAGASPDPLKLADPMVKMKALLAR